MSKRGRKGRRWHYRRIQVEFGQLPEEVIRDFFAANVPLTTMAGILGISYGEMHEWVKELGLSREPILRDNPRPTRQRINEEYGLDAVRLICSERACGMTYQEIRGKYGVSSGFVAHCLHLEAPWLIGTPMEPVTVGPPKISDEERQRRSERCQKHNRKMKARGQGWFADMDRIAKR